MTSSTDRDAQLERLIGDTLRAQSPRRAPASLEARVLREIALRATTPWWRMSFGRWPMAAQVVFVAACAVIAKFAIDVSTWVLSGLESVPVARDVASAVVPVKTSLQTLIEITAAIFQHIPSLWIYGGIGVVAIMYAALFGISAAAYRTLYVSR